MNEFHEMLPFQESQASIFALDQTKYTVNQVIKKIIFVTYSFNLEIFCTCFVQLIGDKIQIH